MNIDETRQLGREDDEPFDNHTLMKEIIDQEMIDVVDHLLANCAQDGISLKEFLDCLERHLLIMTLSRFGGSQKKTSEFLDMKPTTMNAKCKKYRIKFVKQVL